MRVSWMALLLVSGSNHVGCGPDCRALQDEGQALVDTYQACKAGDECVVVNLDGLVSPNCTGAFACSAFFKKGSDLAAFAARAREIESQYKDCRTCSQASCAPPPSTAKCNVATGRCEGVP